eukprot:CAMPEP_0175131288 /NCGR_PEP_ID=MMETSP0087-20121206/6460_1 /TAXON_ID=136419 /ORGANISM="Unknown Unknown, Strain D1" /LENGTH=265 /DNA_ID=CAMNT_0016413563 /DNA_START=199 /DNA_END=996 /DNA_ORIENTATION=-
MEFVQTRRKQRLACLRINYEGAKTVILFAHGNATDLGAMRDHLIDMSINMKVNVYAYDYSGYGLSSGKPNPANTFADADAVYQNLVNKYNDEHIILYGQSLGSGPSLYLGKKYKDLISGIVIHSGLMSGLAVLKPIEKSFWFDIYKNAENVKQCVAPLYVIHGTEDVEIPINHGIALAENSPNCYPPWFVEGAEHNNIEVFWRRPFFQRLNDFIRAVENGVASQGQSGADLGLQLPHSAASKYGEAIMNPLGQNYAPDVHSPSIQ